MKTRLFIVLSAALLAGCQSQYTKSKTSAVPDYDAIAKAASQASHQYMTKLSQEERAGNLIPRQFWGEAIEQLDPLRVEFDRVNIAIVLSENERFEEGYYYVPMISSFIPFNNKYTTFTKLTSNENTGTGTIPQAFYYYQKLKETEK
jgi:hypothetical protein